LKAKINIIKHYTFSVKGLVNNDYLLMIAETGVLAVNLPQNIGSYNLIPADFIFQSEYLTLINGKSAIWHS